MRASHENTKQGVNLMAVRMVLNRRHGGFSLSQEALEWLVKEKGWRTAVEGTPEAYNREVPIVVNPDDPKELYSLNLDEYDLRFRTHPDLIEVVETLGERANGWSARLVVAEVEADDIENLVLVDYAGVEMVFRPVPVRW